MVRISPFWFKRHRPPALAAQRNITLAQVQTPGSAVSTDIIGLYNLDDAKTNLDPNTLGLYGTWTGTPAAYGTHIGILSDNGFSKYLDGTGIQKDGWGAGALDTYYNADGITLSWIARVIPATGARLLQYWQADLEYIDLYFVDVDTIRLSVIMGSGTLQSDDVAISTLEIDDGNFHHLSVTFHPGDDRIAYFYVNGVLACQTAVVAGAADFGDEVANIRRGIGFGCSYTGTDIDASGDVDHCTILKGVFPSVATGLDGRMKHYGIYMRYYGGQMYYNPGALPAEGDAFYGIEAALYEGDPAIYSDTVFVFRSGVPHWTAYD